MARSRSFVGIGASPGVAIGRVLLLDRRDVRVRRYHIEPDQIDAEIARLRAAIDQSIEQLEAIRNRFKGQGLDHHTILDAHVLMLKDPAVYGEAVDLISKELRNAEWAVDRVLTRLRSLFDRATDTYIRDRRNDIDFVGERILRNLAGQVADVQHIDHVQDGTVVVAYDLSPADTALLSRHRITAFVTEMGGKTSHTSIVARSLGVPAVVGVHGVFDAAGSGDLIMVDGLDGRVVLRPTSAHLDRARRRAERYQRVSLDLLEAKALPARTIDGFDVTITGNIELPNEVQTVLERGGEGIGLYRTEFMYLGRSTPPTEEDHYRTYCQIFHEVGDRSVTVRTFDLGGEKVFTDEMAVAETNPALGMRAVRYCLAHPEVFEPQIAGLLRAGCRGRLRIMLPMISGLEELRQVRDMIHQVQRRLERDGKEHDPHVPIGMMIEVPSAVLTLDLLAQEVDFFAIGTNDLMQYLLAIDRTNDRVAYLYDPLHPAMLRTLQRVATVARDVGIGVTVCGEMAGDREQAPILVGYGFDQLSMNAGSIPQIKRLIRELRREDCVDLVEEAARCRTHREVDQLVHDFLEAKAPLSQIALDGGDDEP